MRIHDGYQGVLYTTNILKTQLREDIHTVASLNFYIETRHTSIHNINGHEVIVIYSQLYPQNAPFSSIEEATEKYTE